MRCDEVVRELAAPTAGSGSGRDGRTPGRLPGLRRLGPAGRAARSALGCDPPRRAIARGLGCRLVQHRAGTPRPGGIRRRIAGVAAPLAQWQRTQDRSRIRRPAPVASRPRGRSRRLGRGGPGGTGAGRRDPRGPRPGLADAASPRRSAEAPARLAIAPPNPAPVVPVADPGGVAGEGRRGHPGGAPDVIPAWASWVVADRAAMIPGVGE